MFKVPERPSKLDPYADKLSGWLRIEAGKSRKQRRTVKQMHADLVELGFDGSYGRVAAFARKWKAQLQYEQQTSGRGTFVPLVFAPGEAFQFDWSEDWAMIAGERVKLQAAHTKLSHSKVFIVRAYATMNFLKKRGKARSPRQSPGCSCRIRCGRCPGVKTHCQLSPDSWVETTTSISAMRADYRPSPTGLGILASRA